MKNLNDLISSLKIKSLFYYLSSDSGYKIGEYYTSLRDLYIDIYNMKYFENRGVYGTDTLNVTIHFLKAVLSIISTAEEMEIDLSKDILYCEIINEILPNIDYNDERYSDELNSKTHWKRKMVIKLYRELNNKKINSVDFNNIDSLNALIMRKQFINLDTIIRHHQEKGNDIAFYHGVEDLYSDIRKILYKKIKPDYAKRYMLYIVSNLLNHLNDKNALVNCDPQFIQLINLYKICFDINYTYYYDDTKVHLLRMEHNIRTNK